MPKGSLNRAQVVTCRGCGREFRTKRTGKQAWYCGDPECDRARAERRREEAATRKRVADQSKREMEERRRVVQEQFADLTTPRLLPLAEDLIAVAKLAADIGPSAMELREAVVALARDSNGNRRYRYRRVAAIALALAAHVGGKRL